MKRRAHYISKSLDINTKNKIIKIMPQSLGAVNKKRNKKVL